MGCSTSILSFFMPQSKSSNLELKMVEALKKRAISGNCTVKTFNSVIMKFPKIDESFEKVRVVFKKYDTFQWKNRFG